MIRRFIAAGALLALAACASPSNEAPAPSRAPPPDFASPQAPSPPPGAAPGVAAPGVVAPGVQAPPAPRPAPPPGDVVVPGQVDRTLPPTGDPRTSSQRAQDIRAWDQCVTRAQGTGDSDPMRPALDSPEDICRQSLGMASRNAVPDFRRR